MVRTSSSHAAHNPASVFETLMDFAMACLMIARVALATTAMLALMSGALGLDERQPDIAQLALALPPDVPAITLAALPLKGVPKTSASKPDALSLASLGPAAIPKALEPDVLPLALTQAIQAYGEQSLTKGDAFAAALPPGLYNASAEWTALRTYPREAGYGRILAFLAAHPAWPSGEWLQKRAEEALFGDRHSGDLVKAAFADAMPRTPAGKIALARVRTADGDTLAAAALVRDVWRRDDFNKLIEKVLLEEFASSLTKADHKYRADRLLYKEETVAALRAAQLAGPEVLALARARTAVISEAASDALIAAVPAALAKDPGLIFSQIQKLRRAENYAAAAQLMLSAPRDAALLINGDEWWTERRMIARAMLDAGDGEMAWRLCAEHTANSASAQVEAEFHAGWIALRFLDDPARARPHFTRLAQIAESSATAARAAYWLGRTQEALGDIDGAGAFYAAAARHPTFFYGQLARAKVGMSELALRPMPDAVGGDDRAEAVKISEILLQLGKRELAAPLIYDSARNLGSVSQVAALAAVVSHAHDAALSLQLGKIAAKRGIALDELAFPDFGVPEFVPLAGSADQALIYSIVRQESAFLARVSSGAGAKGLMQLMVATARKTALQAGVAFDAARLTSDPAFNTQLGAAHLGTLFSENDGSYILTFAAYNAGGGRVKQWLTAYGDPRRPEIDAVDWIELIPITETRQYVQHILENLQVYRARLGQHSGTMLEADLHARGGRF